MLNFGMPEKMKFHIPEVLVNKSFLVKTEVTARPYPWKSALQRLNEKNSILDSYLKSNAWISVFYYFQDLEIRIQPIKIFF